MVYLDNSATTAPFKEVLESYVTANEKFYANAASIHQYGNQSEKLLTQARQQIADLLGIMPNQLYFTSGGTESNNLALFGAVKHKQQFGKHIITSKLEHPSVLEVFYELEKQGFKLDLVNITEQGQIDIAHLAQLITSDTILLSCMQVNNIVGTIQPIAEIAQLLKDYPKVHFHVDGVQAAAKLPLDLNLCDSYSFSSHKFHGIKGVGGLYIKQRRTIMTTLFGGHQEDNIRSGTVNVPGIVAMAKAFRQSKAKYENHQQQLTQFYQQIVHFLSQYQGVVINTPLHIKTAEYIINFAIKGIRGEVIVNAFSQHHVMLSTTSACASRRHELNDTLTGMGIDTLVINGSVRLSFGLMTTQQDIDTFKQAFDKIYPEFVLMINKYNK